MKKELIIIICLLTTIVSKAQIDTTSWYPLQIGNYWEYSSYSIILGDWKSGSTVIGDTLMPNNKVYKIIEQIDLINPENISYSFLRLENNAILYSYRFGTEIKEIDFTKGLMELWLQGIGYGYRGLVYYSFATNGITGISSTIKAFEYFVIDSSFVPPDTSAIMDVGPDIYQRGIGEVQIGPGMLTGAILNGVRYGIVTDVENNLTKIDKFILSQNYPNPFNPSTIIAYSIPKNGFVQLKIYDILGREVASLVNEEQLRGSYQIKFFASNLSSGIYFYRLQSSDFVETKKLIVLK